MSTPHRWTITRAEDQTPLLDSLTRHLNISRKQAKRLLDARSVFVNRQRVWMARHPLHTGDQIEVMANPAARETARTTPGLVILREHADWLVVNKPAGLTTNDGPASLEALLRKQRGEDTLEAVHRLDRDTTGCVLFARRPEARDGLVGLFEDKVIRKTYLALVQGAFPPGNQVANRRLEGLEAETEFRLLERGRIASLVEARPKTGRTHQVRLHARDLGHPLAGDRVYATGVTEEEALRRLPRQMLHAWKLSWTDPEGTVVSVVAPWPDDFRKALRSLGLQGTKSCAGT